MSAQKQYDHAGLECPFDDFFCCPRLGFHLHILIAWDCTFEAFLDLLDPLMLKARLGIQCTWVHEHLLHDQIVKDRRRKKAINIKIGEIKWCQISQGPCVWVQVFAFAAAAAAFPCSAGQFCTSPIHTKPFLAHFLALLHVSNISQTLL